jgi:hypothetical protein
MAGATDLAIRIATTLDSSGITRANKAVGKLQKSVKTLSGAIGGLAIAAFAKKSLSAFVDDELAATRLANAVKNLGMEFANPYISDYISKLEQSSQVADDVLRPAFQRLLQQTGSLAKSQSILNTAIEVSRGSGENLTSVAEDLAKAYYGNTKSLQKYSLGLTKAELQTKSFAEIQDILNKKFTGSNAAYLDTYAGQLNVLSLAYQNLQENAGKALFTLVGANGDTGSGAKRLGGAIDAFGTGLVTVAEILNNAATAFGQAYFGVGSAKPEVAPAPVKGQELFRQSSSNDAKLKAIEKRQAALYKQQLAATKALTAEQKKQAALKKAGTVFDLEQIQVVAALKNNLSKEERMRVEALAALLNDNDVLASSLTKQILMAQDSSGKLYQYFLTIGDTKIKNPFEFLDQWVVEFQKKLNSLSVPKLTEFTTNSGTTAIAPVTGAVPNFTPSVQYPTPSVSAGEAGFIGPVAPQVIELKITGDGDLTNTIAKNLMQQSLSSGNQTYVNRRTGGFE